MKLEQSNSIPSDYLDPNELEKLLEFLTLPERAKLDALLLLQVPWEPFPESPQQMALESKANVIGFGGAAGGGKTDLLLGAAFSRHHRSIIFRREYAQLDAIIERSHDIFGGKGRFRASPHPVWRLDSGQRIQFGGVESEKDVQAHQGHAHDLKGFDELTHFTEYQFRYLKGWNRTSRPGQLCRTIATFNPPTTAEGDWVIRYFGPWLDKRHPRPARDGELRWYAMLDGIEREVRCGEEFWWPRKGAPNAEFIKPQSRTFIRSFIEDNPVYMARGYRAELQALPEPLRSLMLKGDFDLSQVDHPWQVIPTAWAQAAMDRWRKRARSDVVAGLTDIGVDVARGGLDKSVYAPRVGNYIDELIVQPGKMTPNGQAVIRDVINVIGNGLRKTVKVKIDAVAVGSSPVDLGKMFGLTIVPMYGGGKSGKLDKSKKLGFFNKRAEWTWGLREMLDPANEEDIELPPSRSLLADLTAIRWEWCSKGVKIEDKAQIKERIRRSPDEGEAVIYAFGHGSNAVLGMPLVYIGGRPDSLNLQPDRTLR